MTSVDPVYAQWLQSDGLWQVSDDATIKARWGDKAQTSERMTTIAAKSDAASEAVRQIAFLGGPLVIDEHMLLGEWSAYLGRVITITIDRLGYDAGVDVFLIGAEDDRSAGTSKVTVIRRLS